MDQNLSTFAAGFALYAALIVAIGAQNLFVLQQGLFKQHVGTIVLFCAVADAVLMIAGVLGLGAALNAVPELTQALTIGGALFLVWYGLMALKRMMRPSAMIVTSGLEMSKGRAIASIAAFTFLNPHVYLDTLLLMGAAGTAQPEDLRPIFIAGAATASFVWFVLLGYGARVLTPLFSKPIAWRVLDAIVGVTMLALAASLIRSALQ